MPINAVIMSGGAGTRLWPLSDEAKPKQFLNLLGDKSLLQQTVERLDKTLFSDSIIFLANTAQAPLIDAQIKDRDYLIIGEPCRRNTAAAAAAAALYVRDTSPKDDLILLLPADHSITDVNAFNKAIREAEKVARNGYIVTFGITPDHPETGYGYIKRGNKVSNNVFYVDTFKEKPDLETAKTYCDSGLYNWNAGIFLFSAHFLLEEINRFHPEILMAVRQSYKMASRSDKQLNLDKDSFETSPSISIDYAVMEKTDKATVIPCDIGWSDIGSFQSLRNVLKRLGAPRHPENAKLVKANDCLIQSDGPQINIIGLDNIGVIVKDGHILVLNLDNSQDVKQIAEI